MGTIKDQLRLGLANTPGVLQEVAISDFVKAKFQIATICPVCRKLAMVKLPLGPHISFAIANIGCLHGKIDPELVGAVLDNSVVFYTRMPRIATLQILMS